MDSRSHLSILQIGHQYLNTRVTKLTARLNEVVDVLDLAISALTRAKGCESYDMVFTDASLRPEKTYKTKVF